MEPIWPGMVAGETVRVEPTDVPVLIPLPMVAGLTTFLGALGLLTPVKEVLVVMVALLATSGMILSDCTVGTMATFAAGWAEGAGIMSERPGVDCGTEGAVGWAELSARGAAGRD